MPSHIFKINDGQFGLSLTDPGVTDPCSATLADYDAYTCQITSGALTASANVSSETVPATWCEPERNIPQVGETSYSLDMTYLQDPDVVDGLSRFLFEHDTELAWFYMGLDGDNPPKAVGQVRLVSGAIGGEGRTTLTADVSLPLEAKPAICFGDASASEAVGGGGVTPTGATEGAPGSFTPPGATPPADLSAIQALGALGNTTAWATDSYVELGDGSDAYWDGSDWASGVAPQ